MINELLEVIAHELLRYGCIIKSIDFTETNETYRLILYGYKKYEMLMQDGVCKMVKLYTK